MAEAAEQGIAVRGYTHAERERNAGRRDGLTLHQLRATR
jgi:hypothetical protein